MSQVAIRGFVSGRVQGVGFRWFALDRARTLGLAGWVRNVRDGRVEFQVQGDAAAVDRFMEAIRVGPPAAVVTGVTAVPADVDPAVRGFEIRPS